MTKNWLSESPYCWAARFFGATMLAIATAQPSLMFANGFRTNPTICSITLEGDNEKNAFERHLGDMNFNFIELATTQERRDDDWFDKACQSGVQCDVLIISGHFGGTFFGKSGLNLSLSELEKHSCSRDCPGILSNPKEVFLFGCNTLATKEKDSRTPEEYLQVLLNDGISRADAERIVESRYGASGEDNQSRMRRIFEGAGHIYGFNSVGPSGTHAVPGLETYLAQVGDYRAHLDYFANNRKGNLSLAQAMRNTSFIQTLGISSESDSQFKDRICTLYNKPTSLTTKLDLARQIISEPDFLVYLPALESFFSSNPPPYQDADIQAIFEQIKGNERSRLRFQALVNSLRTPILKFESANFGHLVGWLNASEFHDITVGILGSLLHDPGVNLDAIRDLSYRYNLSDILSSEMLDSRIYTDTAGLRALTYIVPRDPTIVENIFKQLGNSDETIRNSITWDFIYTYGDGKIPYNSPNIRRLLASFMVFGDHSDTRGRAAFGLEHFCNPVLHDPMPSDCREGYIPEACRKALDDMDVIVRLLAGVNLLNAGLSDSRIYNVLADAVNNYKPKLDPKEDEKKAIERYHNFSKKDSKIAEILGLKKPDPEILKQASPPPTSPQPLESMNLPLGPNTP